MTRKEAASAYKTIISFARHNDKPRLIKFMDAYISGEELQIQNSHGDWINLEDPTFTMDSINKIRIKPGLKPYNAAQIHKVNGKRMIHTVTGESRYFFVDSKHKATAFKKDRDVSAMELLKEWKFEDGVIPGSMPIDPAKASIPKFIPKESNVSTNVAGIRKASTQELSPEMVLRNLEQTSHTANCA